MQDSFLIEDWYHFEDFAALIGTGREFGAFPQAAARGFVPTALEFTDPSPCTMVLFFP